MYTFRVYTHIINKAEICVPQLLKYQTFFLPLPTICNLLHLIQYGLKSNLSAPNFKSVYSAPSIVQRTRLHPTILNLPPLGFYIQMFGQVYLQQYMYEMSSTLFCSTGVKSGVCSKGEDYHSLWYLQYTTYINKPC